MLRVAGVSVDSTGGCIDCRANGSVTALRNKVNFIIPTLAPLFIITE